MNELVNQRVSLHGNSTKIFQQILRSTAHTILMDETAVYLEKPTQVTLLIRRVCTRLSWNALALVQSELQFFCEIMETNLNHTTVWSVRFKWARCIPRGRRTWSSFMPV